MAHQCKGCCGTSALSRPLQCSTGAPAACNLSCPPVCVLLPVACMHTGVDQALDKPCPHGWGATRRESMQYQARLDRPLPAAHLSR